jgi:hypothetical protein
LALEVVAIELMHKLNRIQELSSSLFGKNVITAGLDAKLDDVDPRSGEDYNMYRLEHVIFQLTKLKELVSNFLVMDPQRTGSVSCDDFKTVIYRVADYVFGETPEWMLDMLVNDCFAQFRDSLDDSISYLDFWSILFAGILQADGKYELDLQAVGHYMKTIKRGIEYQQVLDLVEYVGNAQSPAQDNSLWTSLHPDHELRFLRLHSVTSMNKSPSSQEHSTPIYAASSQSGISREGLWSVNLVSVPTDDPGMMTVRNALQQPALATMHAKKDTTGSRGKLTRNPPQTNPEPTPN